MTLHSLTSYVSSVWITVNKVKGNVNYCLQALLAFLPVQLVFGENTQHLSNSCIELSGLSFSQPPQLLHCHFPKASYFTIPKLIGFVPVSETWHIRRCTYARPCTLAAGREGQDASEHTDGADRGTSTENWSTSGCKWKAVSREKRPIEFPLQQQIILLHMLYAHHEWRCCHCLCQTIVMQYCNTDRITVASVQHSFSIYDERQTFLLCQAAWLTPIISGIDGSYNQGFVSLSMALMEQQGFRQTVHCGAIMMRMAPHSGRWWWENGYGWKSLFFRGCRVLPLQFRMSLHGIEAQGCGPISLCHSTSRRGEWEVIERPCCRR